MKVLQYTYSPVIGGVLKHYAALSKKLCERDVEVVAVMNETPTITPIIDELKSLNIRCYRSVVHSKTDIKGLFKFFAILSQERPDVVHFHLGNSFGNFLPIVFTPLYCPRTVIIEQAPFYSEESQKRKYMLKRISLCAVRKIIVAGEAVRQRYIRLYPRSVEKVEVLPTFTTVMPHRSIETISTLGFIGEFVKNKGIDVLLNLAPDLIKKGYHLLFCGKGVFEPQVYALQSQYPAQVRVHYFPVKQEAAFAKIDVLLMLSENENFPYVVLEAISAGIPVISTDVGVIREHYAPGEGILFLADRSKEEIMAHLERLRQNEFRKELIRKGVEKYFSKFSPEMLTDRILALYQGL